MRAKTIQEIAMEEKDKIMEYADYYLREGVVRTCDRFKVGSNLLYEYLFLRLPLVDEYRYKKVLETVNGGKGYEKHLAEKIVNDYLNGESLSEAAKQVGIASVNRRKLFETLVEVNFELACKLRNKMDKNGRKESLFSEKEVLELGRDFIKMNPKDVAQKHIISMKYVYDIFFCRLPFIDFELYKKAVGKIGLREDVRERDRLTKLGKDFLKQKKSLASFSVERNENLAMLYVEFSTKLARYDLELAIDVKNRLLQRTTKRHLTNCPSVEAVANAYIAEGASVAGRKFDITRESVYNYLKKVRKDSPLYSKIIDKKKENEKFKGNGARSDR